MSVYSYLLAVEKDTQVFPLDRTLWERFCCWLLRSVFGARYWHEVAVAQSKGLANLKKSHAMDKQDQIRKYEKLLSYHLRVTGQIDGEIYQNLSEIEGVKL